MIEREYVDCILLEFLINFLFILCKLDVNFEEFWRKKKGVICLD